MRLRSAQRGETLVEVIMALAILSLVLTGSYVLATGSFRQGRGAGERTQAANYLQEQAEALRTYRNSNKWTDFTGKINSYTVGGPTAFCMKKTAAAGTVMWQPVAVDASGNCKFDGIEIKIQSKASDSDVSHVPPEEYTFEFRSTWTTGPDQNNTSITTQLTKQDE